MRSADRAFAAHLAAAPRRSSAANGLPLRQDYQASIHQSPQGAQEQKDP
jgi:hypothetical protein